MPLPTYNAIQDDATLSILRYGASTFVAGAGETLFTDVGKKVSGVDLRFQRITGGVMTAMDAGEITTAEDAISALTALNPVGHLSSSLNYPYFPLSGPETISGAGTVLSLDSYLTVLSADNAFTLAAGKPHQLKKIVHEENGETIDITCSPRLRGAAGDILRLTEFGFAVLIFDVREFVPDRWIVIDGSNFTLV